MPTHRVPDPQGDGRECWQWGLHGATYCGKDAKQKADAQGRVITEQMKKRGKTKF